MSSTSWNQELQERLCLPSRNRKAGISLASETVLAFPEMKPANAIPDPKYV
jgi:hypothetical protein